MAETTTTFREDTIRLELGATTKAEAITELIGLLDNAGVLIDRTLFEQDVLAREALSTTGLGDGIAIPHGKSNGIAQPTVAFARSRTGIDWGSPDGSEAHLMFLIGVPEADAGSEHLVILAKLARSLMREDFRRDLLSAETTTAAQEVLATLAL